MTNEDFDNLLNGKKMPSDDSKVRATWHSMLKEELSLIDEHDLINPDAEVDDQHETVVGVAPIEDQKMYTYAERLEEKATRILVDARFTRDGSTERERLTRKSFEMTIKSQIVRDILWANLKDEFDLWAPHLYVGLRKDFVVVSGNKR
jgi:hypothetical protein